MTKLLELQKAVANRNFEHDAIDEDLEFVDVIRSEQTNGT